LIRGQLGPRNTEKLMENVLTRGRRKRGLKRKMGHKTQGVTVGQDIYASTGASRANKEKERTKYTSKGKIDVERKKEGRESILAQRASD